MGHCWMHVYDLNREKNALYTCNLVSCNFRCKSEQVIRKHVAEKRHEGFTDHRLELVEIYRKMWSECFPKSDEERILLKYSVKMLLPAAEKPRQTENADDKSFLTEDENELMARIEQPAPRKAALEANFKISNKGPLKRHAEENSTNKEPPKKRRKQDEESK